MSGCSNRTRQRATVVLPEPEFADDPQRLTAIESEADVLGGVERGPLAEETPTGAVDLVEVLDRQHAPAELRAGGARRQARHRRDQRLGVLLARRIEDRVRGADLHQLAVLHHRDLIGDLRHHAEVVRDEHDTGAVPLLQLADEAQDLGLRRHVERGGRFVRHQDLRVEDQRHGDHRTLALAAGELVRIGCRDARRVRELHFAEEIEDLLAPLPPAELGVNGQHLVDLLAHRHQRVQRRHRLLEDHRELLGRASGGARWARASGDPGLRR